MTPSHATLRDPELPHQVVLQAPQGRVVASCNCRLEGAGNYAAMGPAPDLAAARRLYNDPANHDKPFDPERDGARW